MEKEILLKQILEFEAKEAEFGAKASELRKEYCMHFSPFKKDEKIILILTNSKIAFGIINSIKFNTNTGFIYVICPRGKNWSTKTNRKAFYRFELNAHNYEVKEIRKQL